MIDKHTLAQLKRSAGLIASESQYIYEKVSTQEYQTDDDYIKVVLKNISDESRKFNDYLSKLILEYEETER